MPDVYIAGSLRHTPKEWWSIYEKMSEVAKKMGLETFVPHIDCAKMIKQKNEELHNPNADMSKRVKAYKTNLEAIKNSKLLVAEVTNTSTGTGFEIGFALEMKKPVICMARKDVDVTSMVLAPAHLGLIKMIRYDSEKEALEKLENELKEMFNSNKP